MKFAYFVSGHGFGHISRSFEIIKELLSAGHSVYLFTERGRFLEGFSNDNLREFPISTDLGISQASSLEIDLPETKRRIQIFQSLCSGLTERVVEILRQFAPDRIISDASSFPFTIAKRMGIKGFFLGNFTWDFIYAHYANEDPFFSTYANSLKEEYKDAHLGLVLPFHCPILSIQNLKFTGLVGRKPTESRETTRKKLSFSEDNIYLLFSFGAYGLDSKKFKFENLNKNIQIITSGLVDFYGPGVREVSGVSYPNLLQACDAVVTKPGYGILAESYYANTPVIYTDRGNFLEYDYLVDALKRHHRSVYVSQDELFSLNLEKQLHELASQKEPSIDRLEDGIPEIIHSFL